jgi:hypothetical protein
MTYKIKVNTAYPEIYIKSRAYVVKNDKTHRIHVKDIDDLSDCLEDHLENLSDHFIFYNNLNFLVGLDLIDLFGLHSNARRLREALVETRPDLVTDTLIESYILPKYYLPHIPMRFLY